MTSRNSKGIGAAVAGVACVVVVAAVTGCGSDEPEPTAIVARVYAPPPPAPPTLTPISELMIQLGIDERVRLPEDKAPDNDEARRAVLEFFDAFARGDDQVVASMVSTADRLELEALVDSGAWDETTNQITRIDVQTGSDPEDASYTCALAVLYVGSSHQPQLWHYSIEFEGARFDAAPTPPGILDRLSGVDWIAAWFAVLAEEEALANKPDEDYRAPQKIYATGSSGGGGVPERPGVQPGGPGPLSPGGPGPGRRKRPPRRKPPGPP